MDAALVWFEAELQKLDLEGRGDLYTHLLQQEIVVDCLPLQN